MFEPSTEDVVRLALSDSGGRGGRTVAELIDRLGLPDGDLSARVELVSTLSALREAGEVERTGPDDAPRFRPTEAGRRAAVAARKRVAEATVEVVAGDDRWRTDLATLAADLDRPLVAVAAATDEGVLRPSAPSLAPGDGPAGADTPTGADARGAGEAGDADAHGRAAGSGSGSDPVAGAGSGPGAGAGSGPGAGTGPAGGDRAAVAVAGRGGRRGLVAREGELGAVRAALDEVPASGSRVVVVSGPAGAGKTAVVDRALDDAAEHDWRVGRARAGAAGEDPYRPLRDLLAGAGHDPAAVLDAADPAAADPDRLRARRGALFAAVLDRLCPPDADRPTALFIDDLHRGDPGTVAFVEYVRRRAPDRPLALVVAVRPAAFRESSLPAVEALLGEGDGTDADGAGSDGTDDADANADSDDAGSDDADSDAGDAGGDEDADAGDAGGDEDADDAGAEVPVPGEADGGRPPVRVRVGPLDRSGTRALVERTVGRRGAPADLVDAVHDRTGGVPLFVEETVTALLESEELAPDYSWYPASPAEVGTPAAVEAAVERRLRGFDDAARDLLRWAAVLGDRVPAPVLREVADADRATAAAYVEALAAGGPFDRSGVPDDAARDDGDGDGDGEIDADREAGDGAETDADGEDGPDAREHPGHGGDDADGDDAADGGDDAAPVEVPDVATEGHAAVGAAGGSGPGPFGGPHLTFRSEVVREAVLSSMDGSERRRRHGAVARALAARLDPGADRTGGGAAAVARHHRRAGRPSTAADWYERAGDRAADVYAHEAALENYRTAIDLVRAADGGGRAADDGTGTDGSKDGTGEDVAGEHEAGDAGAPDEGTAGAGAPDEGSPAGGESGRRADRLARLALRVADVQSVVGAHGEARRYARFARDRAEATDLRRRALLELSAVAVERSEYDRAVELAEEGLAMGPAVPEGVEGAAPDGDGDGTAAGDREMPADGAAPADGADEATPTDDAGGADGAVGDELACELLGRKAKAQLRTGEYDRARRTARRQRAVAAALDDAELLAAAHDTLGEVAERRSEFDRAREYYETARERFAHLGDRHELARVDVGLGNLTRLQGELEAAREYLERAIEVCRTVGDPVEVAHAQGILGIVAARQGAPGEARERFEDALDTYRETGFEHGEAVALTNLGELARERGDRDRARERFERAIRLHRAAGNEHTAAVAVENLGVVEREAGRLDSARGRFEDALDTYRAVGDDRRGAEALLNLGNLARHRGDGTRARGRFEDALDAYRSVGDEEGIARACLALGTLADADGRLPGADETPVDAEGTPADAGEPAVDADDAPADPGATADPDGAAGAPGEGDGGERDAREHLTAALGTFRDLGNGDGAATALAELGRLDAAAGDRERARDRLDAAVAAAEGDGGDADDATLAVALARRARLAAEGGDREAARADGDRALSVLEAATDLDRTAVPDPLAAVRRLVEAVADPDAGDDGRDGDRARAREWCRRAADVERRQFPDAGGDGDADPTGADPPGVGSRWFERKCEALEGSD